MSRRLLTRPSDGSTTCAARGRLRRTTTGAVAVVAAAAASLAVAKETKSELKADLRDEQVVGDWNYDDIDAGFARAMREKKPVCVVFR